MLFFIIPFMLQVVCADFDIITDDTPLALRGACISNPCLHGGLCTITPSGFICTCLNGYVGVQCERKADDCPLDNSIHCINGVCKLDMANNPKCICNEGFTGLTCSTTINNCASRPCQNGGTCLEKDGKFECICFHGTSGSLCQIADIKVKSCLDNCMFYKNDGRCWHYDMKTVSVGWGYGDLICNSIQTCFNMSKTENSPYEYMEVQLKPIQMQYNDDLVFVTDRDAVLYDYNFIPHILPMGVDSKEAFLTCNSSNGMPLTNDPKTSHLNVNTSLLRVGTQFFLADTNTLHRCLFGLRLNVTVKDRDCIDPIDPAKRICNGYGKCFTDFNRINYNCLCCDGFTGKYCQFEDPCYVNPCANGAICNVEGFAGGVKHQCICPTGFHGQSCDKIINFCTSAPCQNGGACYTEVNDYRCQCKTGFSGKDCEINDDECAGSPCKNNGTCVDGLNNFQCKCDPGFKGTVCEVDINECARQPCVNGTCLDLVNNYTCACHAGYSGQKCEVHMDECDSQPCINGKCVKESDGFSCSCGIGHTGMLCELKIDLCQHSRFCITSRAKSCVDHGNNVTCTCVNGWEGDNCAVNKDECLQHKCQNNGKCIDQTNGYKCRCLKGFTGLYCEVPPPKTVPDIEIDFMTDNCNKFQDLREVHKLEENIIAILQDACRCQFSQSMIGFGTAHVLCKDNMAGKFMADISNEDISLHQRVVCGMKKMIETQNTPNIYHNTYLVSIQDNYMLCGENKKTKITATVEDTNSTGTVIGIFCGLLLLVLISAFAALKLRTNRRKVGVAYRFERETTSFDNAAYKRKTADSSNDTLNQSTLDETSFMSTYDLIGNVEEDDTKWAYSYDKARKIHARQGNVSVGRLFDIHTPSPQPPST